MPGLRRRQLLSEFQDLIRYRGADHPHCKIFVCFGATAILLDSAYRQPQGRPLVDLTLKLNLLAMCAAFLFVGAILLGAF